MLRKRLIAAAIAITTFVGMAVPAFAFGLTCYSNDCNPTGTTYRLMFKCNDANGADYKNDMHDSAHNDSVLVVQLWYRTNVNSPWNFWTANVADLAAYDGVSVHGYSGDKEGQNYAAYAYWYYRVSGAVWGHTNLDTFAGGNGTC